MIVKFKDKMGSFELIVFSLPLTFFLIGGQNT